ncbi:nitrogenase iron-molybdenum cofactor biosynthesis protein NifN [Neiella sp. HB171785]|uniref:Nitrogenase iron-molybdenum cofactor biosynthesis protein NifN n=1 Tax=Neiella litorisoli TaxID=2771431 RepID=A0A8J6UPG1_9GAMM|nr:nitrogenase iron-molybdenum cofactor biosynthesis protein NifN [Neiella litorisoli]MBD1388247.1 nitrogenase iron-molybdenum cofactor biosynthesis protein NifN [Neiella litorisoli]
MVIRKVNKRALVERPLKTSQPTGATLAMLGLANSIPLMHGSQGCAAFAKVYLIQHFREPVPLQNTAIDQVAAVMGGDDNLLSAIALLCDKHHPDLIAVMTTGLTEMQGADIERIAKQFRQQYPQHAATRVVTINTPDFTGSMQTGYAAAVDALVRQITRQTTPPAVSQPTRAYHNHSLQLNVLASSALTPADVDLLQRYLDAFDIDAIMVPDLSQSLDGHLDGDDFSATSAGGTAIEDIERMATSAATIVIGESLQATGKWLQQHHQVPCHFVGNVMGLAETDGLVQLLTQLTGKPVPNWINRSRQRLQDAMLDCHFVLSQAAVAIAAETDLAAGYQTLLAEQGMAIKRIVTATGSAGAEHWQTDDWVVGDLSDIEQVLAEVEVVVGNSHCAALCEPQVPVLRAGYPCHDKYGSSDTLQLGYEGSRAVLFALANCLYKHHHDEVTPHYSKYRFEAADTLSTVARGS